MAMLRHADDSNAVNGQKGSKNGQKWLFFALKFNFWYFPADANKKSLKSLDFEMSLHFTMAFKNT